MPSKIAQGERTSREKSARLLRDLSETHGEEKIQTDQHLTFGRYKVDLSNQRLWRGKQAIPLTGKAFAVLYYLMEHVGQLVSKAELFAALWPGTAVTDGALTFCIVELRKALRDDAKRPRFIETVHRRGYRFIASVTTAAPPVQRAKPQVRGLQSAIRNRQSPMRMVGRERELAQLHGWLEQAVTGERQIVFVTGELGIGKTTIVEAFLHQVKEARGWRREKTPSSSQAASLWLGRGQCIEQYGAGEAYIPILEAFSRLCREPGGDRLVALLRQHAPTWLVQMPTLLSTNEVETRQRQVQGTTRERMLRELGEAVEAITAERPLVLWLEDLHWSDGSTLELLAWLARRPEPARLLVIGTYRSVDVLAQPHPLRAVKQELQLHGLCAELPLGLLSEQQVAEYLTVIFPIRATSRSSLPELARFLHHRTDGNPLFMVTTVEDLLGRQIIVQGNGQWRLHGELATLETRVPDSLRRLIEQQIERLSLEDRQMLEVASVAGMEFSAAAVAAGTEMDAEVVEAQCAELERRRHFVRTRGTEDWPDGTVATRYRFLHALYQEVLYERIPAGRRRRLHQRIGERREQAYDRQAREIAGELAAHFAQGRDYGKAVHYLQQAGENAVQRSAYQEATRVLTKGLTLLLALPDTPVRGQQELRLQVTLGSALISLKGFTAPDVEHTYARAHELCRQGGSPAQLVVALRGLQIFHLVRGEVRKALELAEENLQLAQQVSTPIALTFAHLWLGESLSYLGELTAAREHLEQAWGLYNPRGPNINGIPQGWQDPGVELLSRLALTLWSLGYPDQAQQRLQQCLALVERQSHPFDLAYALIIACWFHSLHQEWQRARKQVEEAMQLSTEQGFPYWLAYGTAVRGRALAEQGQVEDGIAQMHQGLAAFRATGAELARLDHLPGLALAYGRMGRVAKGLAVLAEAQTLVDHTGARGGEAELYRIKGQLRLQSQVSSPKSQVEEAEGCFHQAIAIARRQQAKSLELRATTSLARLWQQQGKHRAARNSLSEIYGWFTEGFATKDLQEAQALLEELA